MLKLINILFLLIPLTMSAQTSIKGTYDSINKLFITNEKSFWIDFFKGRIAKISKNGLIGLVDTSGNVLCAPKYDTMYDFENDVTIVGLNGKFGLIKIDGEELAIPQFEEIEKINEALFLVKIDGKYGILKNDGKFLSEIKYDDLQISKDKNVVFYNGDDIGLIDLNKGTELPVFKYKKEYFTDGAGIEVFQYIRFFNGYRTNAVLEYNDGLTITYKQKDTTILFGFMDKSFKTIIEPQYEWVEPFKNGYSSVLKNNNWGIIDKTGKLILPMEFESIQNLDNQNFLVLKNGRYGILNNYNKTIIPIKYKSLFYIGNSLYATYNGEKWGLINEKENLILNYEYDGITSGLAVKYESSFNYPTSVPRAVLDFKGYYFDEKGLLDKDNIRISKYVEGSWDFSRNPETFIPYSIKDYNKRKTQNYDFEEVINDEFKVVGNRVTEGFKPVFSPYGQVSHYSKGIINSKAEIIIPLIYDDIEQRKGANIFIVKKDNKYGVINIQNNTILNTEYDQINIIGGVIIANGIIEPNSRIERAVFDFTGKMIIPFKDTQYNEGNAGELISNYNVIDKRKLK